MYSPFREGNFPLCQIAAGGSAGIMKEGANSGIDGKLGGCTARSLVVSVSIPGANAIVPLHLLFPCFSNSVARHEPFEIVIGTLSGSTLA